MKKKVIKTYGKFINEGKREQDKIDELLDIILKRKLTKDEQDLLTRLSKGESLPEENKPSIVSHKTGGGYMFDDQGNVMTEEEPETGREFVTNKGKQKSVNLTKKDNLDARVYRNKSSEERFFFVNITEDNEGKMLNDWLIYRTGSVKYPLGQFMDTKSEKFASFKNKTPEMMWKDNDTEFDYGMVLNDELYQDFIEFAEIFKTLKNKSRITQLREKFLRLL